MRTITALVALGAILTAGAAVGQQTPSTSPNQDAPRHERSVKSHDQGKHQRGGKRHHARHELINRRMAKQLGLSDQQKADLKSLRDQTREEIKSIRASTQDRETLRAQIKQAFKNARSQAQNVLTADQRDKLKAWKSDRSRKSGNREKPTSV